MALCRKETDHVDGEVQDSSRHTQINPKAKCFCRYQETLLEIMPKSEDWLYYLPPPKTKIESKKNDGVEYEFPFQKGCFSASMLVFRDVSRYVHTQVGKTSHLDLFPLLGSQANSMDSAVPSNWRLGKPNFPLGRSLRKAYNIWERKPSDFGISWKHIL